MFLRQPTYFLPSAQDTAGAKLGRLDLEPVIPKAVEMLVSNFSQKPDYIRGSPTKGTGPALFYLQKDFWAATAKRRLATPKDQQFRALSVALNEIDLRKPFSISIQARHFDLHSPNLMTGPGTVAMPSQRRLAMVFIGNKKDCLLIPISERKTVQEHVLMRGESVNIPGEQLECRRQRLKSMDLTAGTHEIRKQHREIASIRSNVDDHVSFADDRKIQTFLM
jgi:hypothetical protein